MDNPDNQHSIVIWIKYVCLIFFSLNFVLENKLFVFLFLGGERWRAMSDEEKRKYIEKQSEEKLRYEASMEEYRKKVCCAIYIF